MIIDVFHALHMTIHYINKIHLNRGHWPRSFTLYSLVARHRGLLCDSVKIVIRSGKTDNASLF